MFGRACPSHISIEVKSSSSVSIKNPIIWNPWKTISKTYVLCSCNLCEPSNVDSRCWISAATCGPPLSPLLLFLTLKIATKTQVGIFWSFVHAHLLGIYYLPNVLRIHFNQKGPKGLQHRGIFLLNSAHDLPLSYQPRQDYPLLLKEWNFYLYSKHDASATHPLPILSITECFSKRDFFVGKYSSELSGAAPVLGIIQCSQCYMLNITSS